MDNATTRPDAERDQAIQRYRDAVLTARLCASMLAAHDVDELIAAIDRADAIAPLVHPSLWIQRQRAMREDRELLVAARTLAGIGKRLEGLSTPEGA